MDNGEVLAFVLYFILMLGIGAFFFFKERGAGEKEYFLGGRSMGPWVTAMSAQASDMSAWLLMGLPGRRPSYIIFPRPHWRGATFSTTRTVR